MRESYNLIMVYRTLPASAPCTCLAATVVSLLLLAGCRSSNDNGTYLSKANATPDEAVSLGFFLAEDAALIKAYTAWLSQGYLVTQRLSAPDAAEGESIKHRLLASFKFPSQSYMNVL